MNRTIKFRAWCQKNGVMHRNWLNLESEDEILMQFTGLRDKNDREIFEGDICRMTFNHETTEGEVTIESTRGTVVGGRPIWPHDVEVIGNKYEG